MGIRHVLAGSIVALVVCAVHAQMPTPTPLPDDAIAPSALGLPASFTEDQSARDTSHTVFRSGGANAAVFWTGPHFYQHNGRWRVKKGRFRADGADDVSDDNDIIVRLTETSRRIAVTDRSGNGVAFPLPARAARTSDTTFTATVGSVELTYTLTDVGIKASATVSRRLGARTWTVDYVLLGDTVASIDAAGQFHAGTIVMPRPFAIGADGQAYAIGGSWELVAGTRVRVTIDDSALPDGALPYVIDPTSQTFNIASTTNDCKIFSDSPYSTKTCDCTSDTTTSVECWTSAGTRQNVLLKWDTSSLGRVRITGATLRLDTGNTNLSGGDPLVGFDWYNWGAACDASDWANPVGTDAYSIAMSSWPANTTDADFVLANYATGVNPRGMTYLRLGCAGGSTGPYTTVEFADYSHASKTEARLIVSYTQPVSHCYNRSSSTWASADVCVFEMRAGSLLIANSGDTADWQYPTKTIAVKAADLQPDGAQCTAASAQINSGRKRTTLTCTDNDGALWWGGLEMPAGWGGGTVKFIVSALSVNATPSGTVQVDCKCQCRRATDAINNTWGTAQSVTLTLATQYVKQRGISPATICDGTCTATGATVELNWQCNINAAGTSATMADVRILDGGVQYQTGATDG